MLEQELFSRGSHGFVRQVTKEELQLFPMADLVKEEKSNDAHEFKRSYYWLKIANLLQPACFIEVVGTNSHLLHEAHIIPWSGSKDGYAIHAEHKNYLFSKKADVQSDHATYAMHQKARSWTVVPCSCEICERHELFHEKFDLREHAEKFNKQVEQKGITVPFKDKTDYCLHSSGNGIIFFEIENMDPEKISRYLDESILPEGTRQHVRHMLVRALHSYNQSVIEWRARRGCLMPLSRG